MKIGPEKVKGKRIIKIKKYTAHDYKNVRVRVRLGLNFVAQ